MPNVTGTVREVYQTMDYAWVRIEDSGGSTTKVMVYSDFAEDYAPPARLVHNNWLAMLRTAMSGGLEVEAFHPTNNGALMTSLTLNS